MQTEFRKYHALGNDYIVIDPREFPFIPAPEAVRAICDRNTGVGSDGILLGPLTSREDLGGFPAGAFGGIIFPWLRIFNPDGSEAEKSGNGLRIFCLHLAEQGYVGQAEFRVGTRGGTVRAQVMSLDPPSIKVDMGIPSFATRLSRLRTDRPEFIRQPLDLGVEKVEATFVSMGNPHCVIFADPPTEALARRLGPQIERHRLFPDRTNVQFLRVVDRHAIEIQIWERGAGYTLASGSSSCAAASVARQLGLVEGLVEVRMPGGTLQLDLSEDSVLMTGPAVCVMEGRFAPAMASKLNALGALGKGNERKPRG